MYLYGVYENYLRIKVNAGSITLMPKLVGSMVLSCFKAAYQMPHCQLWNWLLGFLAI